MIVDVFLPTLDSRKRYAAKCDESGCDHLTLEQATPARAAGEARKRGWSVRVDGSVTKFRCATCESLRAEAQGAA